MKYSTDKKCASCKHKNIISRNSTFKAPIYNSTKNKNNFYRTYYQNFNNKENNHLHPFGPICVNDNKIAKAKWTLNGKTFHLWGNDTVNDPDGIDYTFTLVMVTPQKLVLKMGEGEEYVYSEFRKSNSTLKPVGTTTKKKTNVRRR